MLLWLIFFCTYLVIALAIGLGLFNVGKKSARYPLFMTFGEEQRKEEAFLSLLKGYRIRATALIAISVASTGITLLFGDSATLHLSFMVVWCTAVIFLAYRLNKKYATAAYDLKKEQGWLREPNANAVALDTRVSALKKKMPVSAIWFAVPVWLTVGSLFVWLLAYPKSKTAMVIVLCEILSLLVFIWFYRRVCHAKLKVYSENTEENYAINSVRKRTASGCMIWEAVVCNAYQLFMMVWIQKWPERAAVGEVREQKLYWIVFLLSMTVVTILTFLPFFTMERATKRVKAILGEKESTLLDADEDVYWKNGYYYNPDCLKSDMIPSRDGVGFTVNMASAWGKVTVWSLIFSAALCIGIVIFFAPTEYGSISAKKTEQGITMRLGFFPKKQIRKDEVEKTELIETLPKLTRQWGTGTERFAVGDYVAEGIGDCYAYLDKRAESFLLIQKKDGSYVLFSVKDEEDMEEFYRWLQ